MADENIVVGITANSNFSDLVTDINKVTASLARMQQTLVTTDKSFTNQVAKLNAAFSSSLNASGQFSTHFVSLQSESEKFGRSLDAGKLKLRDYFGTLNTHVKTNGGLIRDLAKQQTALQNAVIQPLGRNAQGLMQYNIHVARGLDEVANKTKIAAQQAAIMNKVVQQGANQLINWGKNTQWAGRQLTVGLTVPMLAFGKAAADAFKQADMELTRLTKVYGDIAGSSAIELSKIRKEVTATARELSASYGASFKETLALSADIAATGKKGQELLGSVTETTRLAILGEVDRAEAMKATLAIQSAFNQNTTELAESINFLNAVENQTSTSLADLVEAIPKAGPVVKGLGGDIKDLALYLTAMREGGINASEGANAIKSSLASLINPTGVAIDKFKSFGIDLLGIVNNNAGNITQTLLDLQTSLDKLDPLQKQQAIEQLFGKFQFARMGALFDNLGKQGSQTLQVLDLMKASSQDLANVASRELTQVTESASGKYRRALEALKADLAGVGEQFLNINTNLIKFVDSIVKFATNLPGPIKSILAFFGGITAIAGPLIMLTGVLGNFFGYIIKGVSHFRALFKGAEGWRMLTPEILAANKAGNLMEKTFYNDAAAATVLKNAISNLVNELSVLESKANTGVYSAGEGFGGAAAAAMQQRVVNKNHPLVGAPYSRASAHMVPRGQMTNEQRAAQTFFGMVPSSIPVNQRIGENPMIYSEGNLPNYPGVTTVQTAKGTVSTGVVAAEAAKHHSMNAALAMMSKTELAELKKNIMQTGVATQKFMDVFDDILPAVTSLTSNAAQESAQIVAKLRAGQLNVEAARAEIVALNLRTEAALGATATSYAAGAGRQIDLQRVPTLNQPIVDASGKSNMRELFKKSGSRNFINKLAGLLGVRTSGAGYNIETTMPKRYNMGGYVFTANDGNIVPGPNVNADVVPAMLTPGEFVVNAEATKKNLPLLQAINGPGSNGPGYNKGSNGKIKLQRTHITDDLSGLALLLPSWVNMGVNANGSGLTGSQIASGIQETLNAGYDPNDLMNNAAVTLGGDKAQSQRRNSKALNQLISLLQSPEYSEKMIGGKENQFGFERLAKDIYKPALRGIKIDSSKSGGTRNLYSAISQIFTKRSSETLTRDEAIARKLISGEITGSTEKGQMLQRRSGRLTWVGQNRTIGSSMPNWARGTNLATLLTTASGVSHALKILKRNAGGMIPGYIRGGRIPGLSKEVIDRLTAKWKPKEQFWPQGHQYMLGNQDPLHGPLQIGKSQSLKGYAGYDPNDYDLQRSVAFRDDRFARLNIMPQFLHGNLEERGKYATSQYMSGNLDIMSQMQRLGNHPLGPIAAMKTLQTKFTGKLFRGVRLDKTFKGLPQDLIEAISLARSTGNVSGLIGKEFIMRRSSWSKSPQIASFFAPGSGVDPNNLVIEASVKNRNILPAGDMFPDKKFLAPYGQDWSAGSKFGGQYKSEQEAIFGGKFRIVGFDKGKLQVETVVDGARKNGGPVRGGRPYLVGENGPEVFVPKNSGGIIPGYAMGGMVKGYQGGGIVRNMIAPMVLGSAGYSLGSSIGGNIGGETGSMIGGMAGSMAGSMGPMMIMGRRSADAAEGVGKFATITSKLPGILKGTLMGVSRLNIAVAAVTTTAVIGYKAFKNYQEGQKLQALSFGLTADAAQKAGLKFTNYNESIKNAIADSKAMEERNQLLYESMTQANTPLKMTIEQYKKLRTEVKSTMPEYIKMFDKADSGEVKNLAAQLKAQFIAAGSSAEEASAKIYAVIEQSKKAGQGFSAISSDAFRAIKSPQEAAVAAANTFAKAMETNNKKGQANSLFTAFQGIDTAIADSVNKNAEAVKKNKEELKSLGQITEEVLNKISNTGAGQITINQRLISEIKKQNPEFAKVLNSTDNIRSSWAKYQLILKGVSVDLAKLSGEAAMAALEIANAVQASVSKSVKEGVLKDQYAKLDGLTARIKKLTAATRGQSVSDQISDKKRVKSLNEQIALINKQANDKIKALKKVQDAENAELDIQRARLEYQQAMARGDRDAAAQAQMRIAQVVSERQTASAEESILANAELAIAPLQAQIEAITNKQEDMGNKAALAGESLGKLQAQADNLSSTLSTTTNSLVSIITKMQTDPTYASSKKGQKDILNAEAALKAQGAKGFEGPRIPFAGGIRTSGMNDLLANLGNVPLKATTVNLYASELKNSNSIGMAGEVFGRSTPPSMANSTTLKDAAKNAMSQSRSQFNPKGLNTNYKLFTFGGKSYAVDEVGGVYNFDSKYKTLGQRVKGLYTGGDAEAGKTYLIGEKGPELFIPSFNGTVIPNNKLDANFNVPNSSWGMKGSPSSNGGVYNNAYNVKIELNGTNLSADEVYNKFEQKLAMLNAKQGRDKMIGGGR